MDYIMNKYQEALDTIVEKTDILNNTCAFLPKCCKSKICELDGGEMCDDYHRVMLLQELIDKTIPLANNHKNCYIKCKCGHEVYRPHKDNYCKKCGQRVEDY